MYQETVEQVRLFLGRVIPSLTAIFFVLVSAVPMGLPGLSTVFPNLALVAIFYWGMYRPESLQIIFIFLLSFMEDILLNMPFGVSAVMNLSLHWIVVTQRHFFLGRSFFLMWLTFCGMLIVPSLLMWSIYSIIYQRPASFHPLIFQYLMTIAIYPFFAWILIHLHRLIVERE